MTHAPDQRPFRSLLGVRGARFVLALCAALLAAMGLGGAAAPGATPSVGSPIPATARAAGHGAVSGTANRVRPTGQHENSKPASAAVHRGQPDLLPVAITVARFGLIEPIVPAGPALTGAPSRAPPAHAGLPDTRAPPSSGRI